MDLADWCSASISHVSLFAWPNHKTQKVRKSLHSVLADLFRVPVRFSQGNLEGKSEVKAGLFCWQASAEAFYFLIFSSSAVQIPDTRHTLACELLLCCSLGATIGVTSSDPEIMVIRWYSILMSQSSLCGRVSSISGGPERGAAMEFSKSLHRACSLSLSDNMSCTYPPVLNCFMLPTSSFLFATFNWNMADALGFRS